MDRAREQLTQSSHKLAEAMYKKQAEGASASDTNGAQQESAAQNKRQEDDVVDAEFEDVK
jgi:molecular chaperone DnaK